MNKVALLAILAFLFVATKGDNISALSILPSERLGGLDAITVVFDSPVIELGSDWGNIPSELMPFEAPIPGSYRWVTTSIFRFDPSFSWPTDLDFNLVLKPIKNWKGDQIAPRSKHFTTDASTMYISQVESKKAQELTGGHWNPYYERIVGKDLVSSWEVPTDGQITIYFNSGIDIDVVGPSLVISGDIPFTYSSCKTSYIPDKCIIITPQPSSLQVDTRYSLSLPVGSKLSNYSGETKSSLSVEFYGLYSFRFPFFQSFTYNPIKYRNYNLYLRHGLNNNTSLTDLQSSIKFTPTVNFNITVLEKHILVISGNFHPNTNYTIEVSANSNVNDGFGLPLLKSGASFKTAPPETLIISAESDNLLTYLQNFNSSWAVFSRNPKRLNMDCTEASVSVGNVNPQNIKATISSLNFYNSGLAKIEMTKYSLPLTTSLVTNVDQLMIPTDSLFNKSGIWLYQKQECPGYYNLPKLISRNNIVTTSLIGSRSITIWVTHSDQNLAIANATVTIYSYSPVSSPAITDIRTSSSVVTDINGIATFDLNKINNQQAYPVVQVGELLHIGEPFSVYVPQDPTDTPKVELITDRSFYKPGDSIYVKGYVRFITPSQKLVIPDSKSLSTASIVVSWKDPSSFSRDPVIPSTYKVNVTDVGTFDATFTIPVDAAYGKKTLVINGNNFAAQKEILISEPRIPTTLLLVTSSQKFYKPGSKLHVDLNLKTYTGVGIPNAKIELLWTLTREVPSFWTTDFNYGFRSILPPSTTTTETGTQIITTDSAGNINTDLSFAFLNPAEEGNVLTIKAQYSSPTKELLSETLTLNVANSDLTLSLKTTVSGDILPGYEFGVFAKVQSIITTEALDKEVNVKLYTWDGKTPDINNFTGQIQMPGNPEVSSCDFTSISGGANIGCSFNITETSKYLLVATVSDSTGYTVTAVLPVGKSLEEWENSPLSSYSGISMVLEKSTYKIGDVASVTFYNPFENSMVMARWGNHPNSKTVFSKESRGTTKIQVPIGDECLGSCYLDIVLVTPRSNNPATLPVPVPTSILFDPLAPQSVVNQLQIVVPNKVSNIDVNIKLDQDIVQPGMKTGFTVSLTKDGVQSSGEVAIFIVDKAVLDLMANPLPRYNETLSAQNLAESFRITDDRHKIASSEGYLKAMDRILSRISSDPWVTPNWPLQPSRYGCINPIDLNDRDFYFSFASSLTAGETFTNTLPPCNGPIPEFAPDMNFSGDIPRDDMDKPQLSPTKGAITITPPTIASTRSKFVTTPFFLAKIRVDGQQHIDWTLPDNVGTFEIRAIAIDSDSAFGTATTDQITRRDFSINSAGPSIVRNGDQFESGITITVHDEKFDGQIVVEVQYVCELLILNGTSHQIVDLKGSGPHLINFYYTAIGTGEAKLLYNVGFQGSIVDSAMYSQSIKGQQEPVFIATSMAISGTVSITEGLKLPSAVPYSGVLDINVGVGRLSAIVYYSDMAFDRMNQVNPYADEYLTSLIPHLVLSKYGQRTELSTFMFTSGINHLKSYTDANNGLQHLPGPNYPYINVRLQAFGLFVLTEAKKLSGISSTVTVTMDDLKTTWLNALNQQIVSDAILMRSFNSVYSDFETLAFVFLGAGTTWTPINADETTMTDLSLNRLIDNIQSLSASGKAALALALLRDSTRANVSTSLITALKETIRVQGRTAYLTEPHQSSPSFTGTSIALQSLVIMKNTVLTEPIANFVALAEVEQSSFSRFNYFWYSSEQLAHFMISLAAYDEWKGNNEPNMAVTVKSENQILLDTFFTSATDVPKSKSYYYEDISNPDSITFSACCSGEASVVFGSEFIPTQMNLEPIYRGINVTKVIQLLDPSTNSEMGPAITSAQIGQKVKVTIQITIPDWSQQIVVEDPFPGALEPLDDSIYKVDTKSTEGNDYFYWYIYNAFSQKVYLPDKVIFYGMNLFPGTHTVSYIALVNTRGKFVIPPAKAYDGNQPELMGLSSMGYFGAVDWNKIASTDSKCLAWNREVINGTINQIGNPITYGQKSSALALGLGIGLGVPVVIGLVVAGVFFVKKYLIAPRSV